MSNKERVIQLLDLVPECKMGYILTYIKDIIADEDEDIAFCDALLDDYENDPDPDKGKTFSLEECKKEWGLT